MSNRRGGAVVAAILVAWIFAVGCDDSTKLLGQPYAFVLRVPRAGINLNVARHLAYSWWEDFSSEGIDQPAPRDFTPVLKPGTSVFGSFAECVRERDRLRRIAEMSTGQQSRLAHVACVALR
jgi:hypothetical protein